MKILVPYDRNLVKIGQKVVLTGGYEGTVKKIHSHYFSVEFTDEIFVDFNFRGLLEIYSSFTNLVQKDYTLQMEVDEKYPKASKGFVFEDKDGDKYVIKNVYEKEGYFIANLKNLETPFIFKLNGKYCTENKSCDSCMHSKYEFEV